LADLLIALAIGFVATLAKRYLDFHLGVPGHAGVGWISVLVAGQLMYGRPPMAVVAGLSMGVWGVPLDLNHSIGYNMALYGLAGGLLDSRVLVGVTLHKVWGAALAGTAIHLAKFGFVFTFAWISLTVRNVEISGLVAAMTNHVLFGIAGGLFGWMLWRLGSRIAAEDWAPWRFR
jgi:hypothetical protein